jgi:hypothetical protein
MSLYFTPLDVITKIKSDKEYKLYDYSSSFELTRNNI